MKAGDIVYNMEDGYPDTRGELEDFLCECIGVCLGPDETDRMSNGYIADTLFRFLDEIVVTDEQKDKLQQFLKENVNNEY